MTIRRWFVCSVVSAFAKLCWLNVSCSYNLEYVIFKHERMPKDHINDKSTMVQVIARRRQATSPYMNQCSPGTLPLYRAKHRYVFFWIRNTFFTFIVRNNGTDGCFCDYSLWWYLYSLFYHLTDKAPLAGTHHSSSSGFDIDWLMARMLGVMFAFVQHQREK